MTSVERTSIEEAARHESELNERQRRVLDLIAAGRTNAEIGAELGITLGGAKWNVSEILTKLGFATREEAADYWRWRNRRGARLGRALRGLLAIPAVKVAAGVGVAGTLAGVAVAAWLLFASGSDEVAAPRVPPFVLEAQITVIDNSRTVGSSIAGSAGGPATIPEESRSTLRWWFRDPSHFRWDIDTASGLDSRTMVMAADGRKQVTYDSSTNTFTSAAYRPLPGGYVLPPSMAIFVGPSLFDNIPAFVESLRHTGSPPMHADVVGEETVLGRATKIIEFGPTSTSSDSSGTTTRSGTGRVWVDPDRMFALRMTMDDSGVQSVRMEVTSLRYGLPANDVAIAFEPPARARQVEDSASSGSGSGASQAVTPVPAGGGPRVVVPPQPGFLAPAYVPATWVIVSNNSESAPGTNETVALEIVYRPSATTFDYLRIQQRKRADGLPAALPAGTPIRFNDHDAYRGTSAADRTFAWEQDGIAVLLTSNALSHEELERIAASMTVQW